MAVPFRVALGGLVALAALFGPPGTREVAAQEPAPRDTVSAPAEPVETVEEIEARLLGELGGADSTAATAAPRPVGTQPTGTLNPDISVIADFVADLSPDESTIGEGDRFQLREVEIGFQGAVDPYFRYDAFVAIHDDEVEIEEAYATTLGLPGGLQVKVGKMLLPFGKVNLTHVPELNTIDLPLLHQEYFGEEGLSSTGVWGSVIGAPLGFFQELSLLATNGAEAGHGHGVDESHGSLALAAEDGDAGEAGKDLFDDLADRLWMAHLKNSFDPSPASNLELGFSWGTSAEDEPERVRTNLYGIDAIWRWKPPQRAKYRSAILQAEVAWRNEAGTGERWTGAFVFGQVQLTRRWYVGARYDSVEVLEDPDATLRAGQIVIRFFPTEFSQLRLAYERREPEAGDGVDRLLFQTTFALGPHRPHVF
jgi:hypothetical protein